MSSNHQKQLKAQIRQSLRLQRKHFSKAEQTLAQTAICKQLIANDLISTHQNIACFLSFDGEISTKNIIKHIFTQQKNCYLPKLKPYKPNRLWFMPYYENSLMKDNRYGIPEVNLSINQAIAVSKIDLVLLPLVAFDKKGNRLGMGGGFYDATFAHLRQAINRPKFIGLAYEMQLIDNLPSDPWDLPLDGVCTEKGFYSFE